MRKFENIKINTSSNSKEKKKITKEEKQRIKEEKKLKREENKNLRKADKEVLKSNKDLLDFYDIDDDDSILMKNGRAIDLFQIDSKDIYSFDEEETKQHIFNYIHFLRDYVYDFKIIPMSFPVNTTEQQEFIKRRLNNCNNEFYRKGLGEELKKLRELEKKEQDKEFYIMIFFNEEDNKNDIIRSLFLSQNIAVRFIQMDIEKKLKILFKINNPNTKLT